MVVSISGRSLWISARRHLLCNDQVDVPVFYVSEESIFKSLNIIIPMQRRTFIHLSAYTAIAIALPVMDGCTSTNSVLEQPLLFAHIADEKTIIEAGRSYRKLIPAEDDKAKLKQLLLGNKPDAGKKMI